MNKQTTLLPNFFVSCFLKKEQKNTLFKLQWILFATLLILMVTNSYAQQDNDLAPTKTVKLALVIIDPPISANNNATFSQSFGWNDAQILTNQTIASLKTTSKGVVDYTIVETHRPNKLYSKNTDQSEISPNQLYEEVSTLSGGQIEALNHSFDYESVLDDYNFCDKVNSDIIDEVWIYAPPFVGMYEARMTGQNAFWINGPTFSSSCVELLPIMGLNYERGVAEALHSYGHRVENVIRKVYGSWNAQSCEGHNFQKFTSYDQICSNNAQVGNIHFPPNGTADYDYSNTNFVSTSAYNWADYPNNNNESRSINCQDWNCSALGYMEWWFDKLPSFDCLNPNDGTLNNWWHYIVDYNDAKQRAAALNNSNCGQIVEPECAVTWTTDNGSISINGLTAPHVIAKLFNPDWSLNSECFDNCNDPFTITNLPTGTYHLTYKLYDVNWQPICGETVDIPVTSVSILPEVCNISFTTGTTSIQVEGLSAPHVIFKLFNPDWSIHSQCFDNCTDPLSITGLVAGATYHVSYKLYNASWQPICSDTRDVQLESNTINLPDLALDNFRIATSGSPGEVVNFTFDLSNIGTVTANGNYVINAFLSRVPQLTADAVFVGDIQTGNTPVGTIRAVPGALTVPYINPGPGTYFLFLIADKDEAVTEITKENNTALTTFTITEGTDENTGTPIACDLNYLFNNGDLIIGGDGLNSGHVIIKVFSPSWNTLYSCFDDCGTSINISDLASGTYHVSIDLYNSRWQATCRELIPIELGNALNDPKEASVSRATLLNTQNELSFTAYPSPTEGNLSIQLPILQNPTQLKVSNLFGQEVLKQNLSPSIAPEILKLDMSDYQNGVYYLELRTKGRRGIQKIIKQDLH